MMNKIIYRSGFISICRTPKFWEININKQISWKKISIVSQKVQTTRFSIRGILNFEINPLEKSQLIFIDTPGLFKPKRNLDKLILNDAIKNIQDVDHSLILYDVKSGRGLTQFLETLNFIKTNKLRTSLVLNKIDLIEKNKLFQIINQILDHTKFIKIFMISAKKGDGCKDLIDYLVKKVPIGNFLYSENSETNLPNELLAEITREKLFHNLGFEIPYNLFVKTINWIEKRGQVKIYQNIFVSKQNHKMIIIGKNGENIKKIGQNARLELEKQFLKKNSSFLFIKVKKNWVKEPNNHKFFGFN